MGSPHDWPHGWPCGSPYYWQHGWQMVGHMVGHIVGHMAGQWSLMTIPNNSSTWLANDQWTFCRQNYRWTVCRQSINRLSVVKVSMNLLSAKYFTQLVSFLFQIDLCQKNIKTSLTPLLEINEKHWKSLKIIE